MKIEEHLLKNDGVSQKESPNRGGVLGEKYPDTIIIHYTAGSSAESSISTLCDPNSNASAHLVVAKDGSITQLVPFNVKAWHAGRSSYQGRSGFNKYSVGIEIDNPGRLEKTGDRYVSWFGRSYPETEVIEAVHRNESKPSYWARYTEEQIQKTLEICLLLADTYPVQYILGHEEISPGRKTDPGAAFPLDKIRDRVLNRNRVDEGPQEGDLKWPGTVTASMLNIRTLPDYNATLAAPPLPRGTKLEILSEENGWLQVDVIQRGWVKKDYVDQG